MGIVDCGSALRARTMNMEVEFENTNCSYIYLKTESFSNPSTSEVEVCCVHDLYSQSVEGIASMKIDLMHL